MAELNQIYKCEKCGNIIEVAHGGKGQLVCCDQPMDLLIEKTDDEGKEKHVPIINNNDEMLAVKVGSVTHPMKEEHHIEWIELLAENKICRKYLSPGDEPIVKFKSSSDSYTVRAYCNIHLLWKS